MFLTNLVKHCIYKSRITLHVCVCFVFSKCDFQNIYLPLAIRRTRMTRIMVGFIGIKSDFNSSSTIPKTDKNTMATSNWFHLNEKTTKQTMYSVLVL